MTTFSLTILLALVSLSEDAGNRKVELEATLIEGERERETSFDPWLPDSHGVTVVEVNASEMGTMSLQDLLERQLSLQVRRLGGNSGYSTASLRGSSPSQLKIFIDGLSLGDGRGATVDLSTLSLGDYQAVEIYRSHVPARFGSGSMGGAINLVSKYNPKNKNHLSLTTGSFGYYKGILGRRFSSGEVEHQLNLEAEKEEGDFEYTDDNLTPDIESDDVRRTRLNNDSERLNLTYRGRRSMDVQSGWQWSLGGFYRDRGLAGSAKFQSDGVRWKEMSGDFGLGYHRTGLFSPSGRTKINLSLREVRERYEDLSSNLGLGVQDHHYGSSVRQLDFLHGMANQIVEQQIHLSLKLEDHQTEDRTLAMKTPREERRQLDLGWELRGYTLKEFLQIEISLSAAFWQDRFSSGGDDDYVLTPSLTTSYRISEELQIIAGVSRGIRHPTMAERFGDRGFSVGNGSLKSERAVHGDMSLEYDVELFDGSRVLGELGVFRIERKGLIQSVYDSRGIGRATNLGDGSIQGVEISGSWLHPGGWSFGGEFTAMDSEVSSSLIAGGAAKDIPGIYGLSANPWLEWRRTSWRFRYDLILERDKYYDAANLLTAADKTLHQFQIQRRFKKFDLTLHLRNIGDEKIEDFNNWPAPGRNGSIQFSTRF